MKQFVNHKNCTTDIVVGTIGVVQFKSIIDIN